MPIGAGRMRHVVTIEELTPERDSHGEELGTWGAITDGANIRAYVEPLSGREFYNARQLAAEVTTRITIWYLPGVIAKMRVAWGSRVFDIDYVHNADESNRQLELLCTERV
jgi:SPP1 family predicted phage head-tail adaptor